MPRYHDSHFPLEQKLLGRLKKEGECLVYIRHRDRGGYGIICVGHGRHELAHRVAYRLFVGSVSDRDCVLHRCNNPPCCETSHLYLGGHSDNYRDTVAAGTAIVGSKSPKAKVDEETVRQIRNLYGSDFSRNRWRPKPWTQQELADEFGISLGTLNFILHRKTWRHVR